MSSLDGRVVIVTGAGRGLGHAHAVLLASLGARVVVNDLGGDVHGEGSSVSPAQSVVDEIKAAGGDAVVSGHDVASWTEAGALVELAVQTFGRLDGLVNNAGILRDRTLANMSETEWDGVIRVHLKGHAATTAHAMAHWRSEAKKGQAPAASVVHTTSIAAFGGSFGQANYSAAKSGIVGLSRVAALEGQRYGVRSNAISPSARTRLGLETPGADSTFGPPTDERAFDRFDPANVSPLVAWLLGETCPATAQIFHIDGNRILVVRSASTEHELHADGQWTIAEIERQVAGRLVEPPALSDFLDVIPATTDGP